MGGKEPPAISKMNIRNEALLPLIQEAYDAFSAGDTAKASAFRAKINIRLRANGEDPKQFWLDFKNVADILAKQV